MLDDVGAITMFVADPQRSKEFYERVFDVPVAFEDANSAAFNFKHVIVNLLNVSQAPGLIGPAEVATSGSRMQLTIWVDETDAVVARLAENGVELLNGPIDRPWGVRTAAFADPDGHVWEVAQQIR
ncbi:MAG TPA: VOC family protein [Gaiellaceae bacterium]|nr:VOC family protein [Gaiellaceae bacterium]